MGLFSRPDRPRAVQEAVTALRDLEEVREEFESAGRDFDSALEQQDSIAFLFGFTTYYADKYKVKGSREIVDLAVEVFRSAFGDTTGIRMFGGLNETMRDRRPSSRFGYEAARDGRGSGEMAAAYFRGML